MSLAIAIQTSSDNAQPLIEKTPKLLRVRGIITPSGNYAAGGDTLDLTTIFALAAGAPGASLPTAALPVEVRIWSACPAATPQTHQYQYGFAPGTTLKNGTMQVFTGAAAQTALTELSAGAYPAGVTGDVILFEACFPVP
jgi:hypothetical protein